MNGEKESKKGIEQKWYYEGSGGEGRVEGIERGRGGLKERGCRRGWGEQGVGFNVPYIP